MKTFLLSILVLVISLPIFAQSEKDTTYWKTNGNASINFSEVSFSNWASGGKSSVSGVGLFNFSANYNKEKISWENSLNLGYGLLKEGKNDATKSEDKIVIDSKLGLKSGMEKLFYTALMNFRTQFANGYNYPNTDDAISSFFAPAYFNLALGADYKPSDKFSLFFSPVSGKATFVTDENLAENYGLDAGKKMRGEFGATLKSQLKTPVVKNVDIETQLTLFSNYIENPQNIDVVWDFLVNMKINDYLSANFSSNLIYDDNIKIEVDEDGDGTIDAKGPRIQFKQLLGIGLSYKF